MHITHVLTILTTLALIYGCAADDEKSGRSKGGVKGLDNGDEVDGGDSLDANPTPDDSKPKVPPKHPPMDPVKPADPTSPDTPTTDPNVPPSQDAAKIVTAMGVRNFRQINQTMSHLTGIPMTDATVLAAYKELETQLPDSNDLRAFIGSHQVAITKLAVEYCDRMVETPAALAAALPGFNIAQTPTVAFSAAGKTQLAKLLVDGFWGGGMDTSPDATGSTDVVEDLIDEVLTGKTMTDLNVTKSVVKGVCSAVLSSGPVTFL